MTQRNDHQVNVNVNVRTNAKQKAREVNRAIDQIKQSESRAYTPRRGTPAAQMKESRALGQQVRRTAAPQIPQSTPTSEGVMMTPQQVKELDHARKVEKHVNERIVRLNKKRVRAAADYANHMERFMQRAVPGREERMRKAADEIYGASRGKSMMQRENQIEKLMDTRDLAGKKIARLTKYQTGNRNKELSYAEQAAKASNELQMSEANYSKMLQDRTKRLNRVVSHELSDYGDRTLRDARGAKMGQYRKKINESMRSIDRAMEKVDDPTTFGELSTKREDLGRQRNLLQSVREGTIKKTEPSGRPMFTSLEERDRVRFQPPALRTPSGPSTERIMGVKPLQGWKGGVDYGTPMEKFIGPRLPVGPHARSLRTAGGPLHPADVGQDVPLGAGREEILGDQGYRAARPGHWKSADARYNWGRSNNRFRLEDTKPFDPGTAPAGYSVGERMGERVRTTSGFSALKDSRLTHFVGDEAGPSAELDAAERRAAIADENALRGIGRRATGVSGPATPGPHASQVSAAIEERTQKQLAMIRRQGLPSRAIGGTGLFGKGPFGGDPNFNPLIDLQPMDRFQLGAMHLGGAQGKVPTKKLTEPEFDTSVLRPMGGVKSMLSESDAQNLSNALQQTSPTSVAGHLPALQEAQQKASASIGNVPPTPGQPTPPTDEIGKAKIDRNWNKLVDEFFAKKEVAREYGEKAASKKMSKKLVDNQIRAMDIGGTAAQLEGIWEKAGGTRGDMYQQLETIERQRKATADPSMRPGGRPTIKGDMRSLQNRILKTRGRESEIINEFSKRGHTRGMSTEIGALGLPEMEEQYTRRWNDISKSQGLPAGGAMENLNILEQEKIAKDQAIIQKKAAAVQQAQHKAEAKKLATQQKKEETTRLKNAKKFSDRMLSKDPIVRLTARAQCAL